MVTDEGSKSSGAFLTSGGIDGAAPKKDSAVAKCADFIMKMLKEVYETDGCNGLTWEKLVAMAREEGLKPKTLRLARTYLRNSAKLLLLYQCKVPESRNMRYMWALAAKPLPEGAEILHTYDSEAEEIHGLGALAVIANQKPVFNSGSILEVSSGHESYGKIQVTGTKKSASPSGCSSEGWIVDTCLSSEGNGQPDCTGTDDSSSHKLPMDNNNNRIAGGVGQRLTYGDLQAQFGVGLIEAAANLGICKTTLKRACRTHGLRRWPRKQIAKLSKTLSKLSEHELPSPQKSTGAVSRGVPSSAHPQQSIYNNVQQNSYLGIFPGQESHLSGAGELGLQGINQEQQQQQQRQMQNYLREANNYQQKHQQALHQQHMVHQQQHHDVLQNMVHQQQQHDALQQMVYQQQQQQQQQQVLQHMMKDQQEQQLLWHQMFCRQQYRSDQAMVQSSGSEYANSRLTHHHSINCLSPAANNSLLSMMMQYQSQQSSLAMPAHLYGNYMHPGAQQQSLVGLDRQTNMLPQFHSQPAGHGLGVGSDPVLVNTGGSSVHEP